MQTALIFQHLNASMIPPLELDLLGSLKCNQSCIKFGNREALFDNFLQKVLRKGPLLTYRNGRFWVTPREHWYRNTRIYCNRGLWVNLTAPSQP